MLVFMDQWVSVDVDHGLFGFYRWKKPWLCCAIDDVSSMILRALLMRRMPKNDRNNHSFLVPGKSRIPDGHFSRSQKVCEILKLFFATLDSYFCIETLAGMYAIY